MIKTIYKKDSKGKIRMVQIQVKNEIIIQRSGLIDGALTVHTSVSKPKNIGKSNQTTAEEQAILEAKSKIEKKLKEGYFETIDEAKNENIIMPMLAKEFNKEKHKIDWSKPVFVQPKLDGMRCISFPGNKKVSRNNTPIENMDHIVVRDLIEFPDGKFKKNFITDGELYIHGESFQTNMTYIKKYRKGLSEKIKYYIYDIVNDEPFKVRTAMALEVAKHSAYCEIVPTHSVSSEEEILKWHKKFVSDGFEGTIIRWGHEGYDINKRSSNLLKHKDFIDEVYKLIDIEPADKAPEQGIAVCQMLTGQTFKANFKFSHSIREEMLNNKESYIGQMAEIRFFEYTDDGIPRFPVCVGFRIDK